MVFTKKNSNIKSNDSDNPLADTRDFDLVKDFSDIVDVEVDLFTGKTKKRR